MLGRNKEEGEGISGRGSGIKNNKVLGDDRAHVWRVVSNPVWPEQRTGCRVWDLKCQSLFQRQRSVVEAF